MKRITDYVSTLILLVSLSSFKICPGPAYWLIRTVRDSETLSSPNFYSFDLKLPTFIHKIVYLLTHTIISCCICGQLNR